MPLEEEWLPLKIVMKKLGTEAGERRSPTLTPPPRLVHMVGL